MTPSPKHLLERLPSTDYYLWILAILFFITGHLLSTRLALSVGGGHETNPIARHIIHIYGWYGLLTAKIAVLTFIIPLWMFAHYLVALDEETSLDTQMHHYLILLRFATLLKTVSRLHSRLPTPPQSSPRIAHTTMLQLIPLFPAVAGIYLTINNLLLTQYQLTLHAAFLQLLHVTL